MHIYKRNDDNNDDDDINDDDDDEFIYYYYNYIRFFSIWRDNNNNIMHSENYNCNKINYNIIFLLCIRNKPLICNIFSFSSNIKPTHTQSLYDSVKRA